MKQILIFFLLLITFISNAQNEATQSEVEEKNGLVYFHNVPFTGILYSDKTANNTCKCTLEASYKNGKLNGIKKEWYNNGKIKSIKKYVNGNPVDKHIFYDENGKKIKEENYKNGKLIDEKNSLTPISKLDAFAYLFKIYEPNEYSKQFLSYFLSITDNRYYAYRNNEFELNRKMHEAEQKIKQRIKDIDFKNSLTLLNYKNSYIYNGTTDLGRYSFDNYRFTVHINRIKYGLRIANWNGGMNSKGRFFSRETPKIRFVNKDMFDEIYLNFPIPSEAEQLKNETKGELYYTIIYKIIPPLHKVAPSTTNSWVFIPNYLDAFITKIIFYTDRKRTKSCYYVNPTMHIRDFININKDPLEKKTTNTNLHRNNNLYKDNYPLIDKNIKSEGKKFNHHVYQITLKHGVIANIYYNNDESMIVKVEFSYFDGQDYNYLLDYDGDGEIDRYFKKNTNLYFHKFKDLTIESIRRNPKLLATKGFGGDTYTYMVDFSQMNGKKTMTIVKGLNLEVRSDPNRIKEMKNIILQKFYLRPKTKNVNQSNYSKRNQYKYHNSYRSERNSYRRKKNNTYKRTNRSYNDAYKRGNRSYNDAYRRANNLYKRGK